MIFLSVIFFIFLPVYVHIYKCGAYIYVYIYIHTQAHVHVEQMINGIQSFIHPTAGNNIGTVNLHSYRKIHVIYLTNKKTKHIAYNQK